MSDDLVMRARAYVVHVEGAPVNLGARIEELEKERDALHVAQLDALAQWRGAEARADRLAALLREAEEKIDGLESDLDSAVEVAYRRGATEWVRLNYPTQFARLEAREVSHDHP